MASDMIERVATAIALAEGKNLMWPVYADAARAAIEALTTDDLLKELDRRLGSEPGQKP